MPWNPSGWQPDGWQPGGWDNDADGTANPVATDFIPARSIIVPMPRTHICRPMPGRLDGVIRPTE